MLNDSTYGFAPDMEKASIRQLIQDPSLLPKIARHARAEGFASKPAQLIYKVAARVYKSLAEAPTATQILQELHDEVLSGKILAPHADEAVAWLRAVMQPGSAGVSSAYVVDKVLSRERQRALMQAIEDAGELHIKGEYDNILPAFQRADAVGRLAGGKGVDMKGSLQSRTMSRIRHQSPRRYGTGITELDDLLGGGLSKDNPLGLVMGGLKSGKSLGLDAFALHLVATGEHVAQFTFENGENEVLLRHDAAISCVPMDQVYSRADEVHEKVDEWFGPGHGSLWIRKMSPGSCVKDTEIELEGKLQDDGWSPTVILWDYTKLMNPNDPKRWDGRHQELGAVTLEMRECLERRGCVGWTAAQVKNSALEKETLVAGDIGHSTEILENVDVAVALCRTSEERNDQLVRFYLAACRFSADMTQTAPLTTAYSYGRVCRQINGLPPMPKSK